MSENIRRVLLYLEFRIVHLLAFAIWANLPEADKSADPFFFYPQIPTITAILILFSLPFSRGLPELPQ
jgi:hypothetical protein